MILAVEVNRNKNNNNSGLFHKQKLLLKWILCSKTYPGRKNHQLYKLWRGAGEVRLDSHSQTFSPSQHTIRASRSEKGQPHYSDTNDQWFSESLCWLWQTLSNNPAAMKTSTIKAALAGSDKSVAPIWKTFRKCPGEILQEVPPRKKPLRF